MQGDDSFGNAPSRTDGENSRPESENLTIRFEDFTRFIGPFSGQEDCRVWLTQLEEYFTLFDIKSLQKLILAKRLLVGSAEKFVQSQGSVLEYEKLKELLLREYEGRILQKDILKTLAQAKLRRDESRLDLAHRLKILGDQYSVQESSLLEFIIEAMPESSTQKQILYLAKNFEDLKEKLRTFDRVFPQDRAVQQSSAPQFMVPRLPFRHQVSQIARRRPECHRQPVSVPPEPVRLGFRAPPPRRPEIRWRHSSSPMQFPRPRWPALPPPPSPHMETGHAGPSGRSSRR